MNYRFLAESVIVFHFAVVLFVVAGALLVLRWRWVAWVHVPVVVWVAINECLQLTCPLTTLENACWVRAGQQYVYAGGFIDHYIVPVLYPAGLTARIQILLGCLVLIINVALYAFAFRRGRRPASPRAEKDIHPPRAEGLPHSA